MDKLKVEGVVKRYNALMGDLCCEHLQIGTSYSEKTEGWNIRDMVSECAFQLEMHYSSETGSGALRYGSIKEQKIWKSEVGKLKRFINAYKGFIDEFTCTVRHCSEYDN